AVVALKGAQCAFGPGAEHTVRATTVVPELEQPLLQDAHVIADDRMVGDERDDPVAEAPTGGVDRLVRLRPDDAVDGQPAVLLDGPDRQVRLVVEDAAGRRAVEQQAQRHQRATDLGHGGTSVAAVDQRHAWVSYGLNGCAGLGPRFRTRRRRPGPAQPK